MDSKQCSKCNQTLSITEFHKTRRSKDGRESSCKACKYKAWVDRKDRRKGLHAANRAEYGLNGDQKKCMRCKLTKHTSDFTAQTARYDKLDPYCKRCKSLAATSETTYISRMLQRARTRAKEANVPFDLHISDIVIPDICPVLGIPLISNSNKGSTKWSPNSPSLDRIVPEKGYVLGNIAVVSYRANFLKNDGTLEEHQLIVKWLEEHKVS